MVRPNPRIKFTVKDYMSTPEGTRYQLLDGEMILAPSPTTRHQRILRGLSSALGDYVDTNNLGEVFLSPLDVVLSDHDVAQPDIMFVSNVRIDIVTEANIQGAPDSVVEILSPGTAYYDQGYKMALYGRHGVREYWLVDPGTETVDVLILGQEGLEPHRTYRMGDTLASPLLEGLALELVEFFSQE